MAIAYSGLPGSNLSVLAKSPYHEKSRYHSMAPKKANRRSKLAPDFNNRFYWSSCSLDEHNRIERAASRGASSSETSLYHSLRSKRRMESACLCYRLLSTVGQPSYTSRCGNGVADETDRLRQVHEEMVSSQHRGPSGSGIHRYRIVSWRWVSPLVMAFASGVGALVATLVALHNCPPTARVNE